MLLNILYFLKINTEVKYCHVIIGNSYFSVRQVGNLKNNIDFFSDYSILTAQECGKYRRV